MSESNVQILANLANYYHWAEERVQKAINALSDEEFQHVNKAIGISIRGLCEHIIHNYNWHFYSSDPNAKFQDVVKKVQSLSRAKLMTYWTGARTAFLEALKTNQNASYSVHPDYIAHAVFFSSDGEGSRSEEDREEAGEFLILNSVDYFLAITDHLTYHRGQLLTHLRLQSKKGVNTDFFTYLVEVRCHPSGNS